MTAAMSFAARFRDAFHDLARHVPGGEEVLIQAMFALYTREHVLWFGRPGRAKSMIARLIFSLFPDARTFATQLGRDTLPEHIFGSEIPSEYIASGKQVYNLDGGLCTADLFYGDEFLDLSDYVARKMNSALNERKFETKDHSVEIPLHTAICTTNFNRNSEALQAVRDRFLCKADVRAVEGVVEQLGMYSTYLHYAGKIPPTRHFPFSQVKAEADKIDNNQIELPPAIQLLHAVLIATFRRKRIEQERARLQAVDPARTTPVEDHEIHIDEITPRTENRLHDFSRAAALLNDRTVVEPNDLRALRYGLVTIGASNGDDACWTDSCNEVITTNRGALDALTSLATICDKVADLGRMGQGFGDVSLRLAGRTSTYTQTSLLQLIDKLRTAGGTTAVQVVADQVKDAISKLGQPRNPCQFPWRGEWA